MSEPERSPWASAPLAAAYVAFPLAMAASRLLGLPLSRNWIDGLWALWAMGCLLAILVRARPEDSSRPGGPISPDASGHVGRHGPDRAGHMPLARPLAALLLALAVLLRFGPGLLGDETEVTPWLMELKPFFYLAVAGLAAAAAGLPGPRSFLRFSAVLAALIILELGLASLAAGEIVRPQGSGEINYDATLLLVGLCLGLPERAPALKALTLAGIAASMSRTTLLSASLVALACWPGLSLARRLAVSLALLACVGLAFDLRGLSMDGLEELDRYWMWSTGLALLGEHPVQAMIGFPPGEPLPVETPDALWALWAEQAQAKEAPGVHAYNFHAFWLRFALTWGLAGVLAALALAAPLFRRGPRARGLGLAMLVQGLTMGLFYLGNVAPVLLLAWWRAGSGLFIASESANHSPAHERAATARLDRAHPGPAASDFRTQGVDA